MRSLAPEVTDDTGGDAWNMEYTERRNRQRRRALIDGLLYPRMSDRRLNPGRRLEDWLPKIS
jgi:hypothetical protein